MRSETAWKAVWLVLAVAALAIGAVAVKQQRYSVIACRMSPREANPFDRAIAMYDQCVVLDRYGGRVIHQQVSRGTRVVAPGDTAQALSPRDTATHLFLVQ